jgi:hypothetical protein
MSEQSTNEAALADAIKSAYHYKRRGLLDVSEARVVTLASEVHRLRTALAEAKRYDPLNAPMALRDMAVTLKDAGSKPCMDEAARSAFWEVATRAELVAGELDRVMPLLAKEAKQ